MREFSLTRAKNTMILPLFITEEDEVRPERVAVNFNGGFFLTDISLNVTRKGR